MAGDSSNPAELYAALITTELVGLSSAESLGIIGSLIDLSDDLGKPEGARRSLELSDLLEATKLPDAHAALLEYFRANAWSVLQRHTVHFSHGASSASCNSSVFDLITTLAPFGGNLIFAKKAEDRRRSQRC
jgi:hypothetical protein